MLFISGLYIRRPTTNKNMLSYFTKNRYNRLTVCALFILVFFWTSSGSTSGSASSHSIKDSALKSAEAGEFSVITYNVAGLPGIISSAVTERSSSIAEIGRILNRFDIAHVQEDFNYNKYLYEKGNLHPFRTSTKGKIPFGDGLNTLSKYPVHKVRRIKWQDCTGADCFTPKGFSYSSIEVAKNVFIDFYNVHANAYNHRSAAEARRKNMLQLSAYIKKNSPENAVVVMGDLNAHYSYFYDNVGILNTENNLEDVWLLKKNRSICHEISRAFPNDDILSVTDSCETIDKILFRGSKDLILRIRDYKLENILFTNKSGQPLSDHHPVSARFQWSLIKSDAVKIDPLLAVKKSESSTILSGF
ncbi:Metal-dependent hydrolase, endonuclease/exonuclease/phosphatase family [Dyadobacter koreensis]|uniref:Metal-dependent hydrolase, endonuclease/exonuclease/phosphatase family n=1 Tax=Dyadobacter koreensis TaxID=408657 RepID=A0A1H6Q5R6_9BACT|nr:endonuclease [Dyadobacter koreensis]SEI37236.1 Metal-dependent hydrolase, endonuclease/exonuclease/phosphatase family [Dyadobacter koreensis]